MRETKGEAVSATELLNNRFTCLQNAAAASSAAKNGFVGSSMQTTMEANRGVEQLGQKFQLQVQECASTFPSG